MPHSVQVVGGVSIEPVGFDTKTGKGVRFGLASSEGKQTKYFNVKAFDRDFHEKGFDLLGKLKKGSQLWAIGRLSDGEYENKEGVKVKTQDLIITTFEFVGGKKKEEGEEGTSPAAKAPAKKEDDRIPF